jgi:hypothetical protein
VSDRIAPRIEIRPAHTGDDQAVERLAQRDSAAVPAGRLLLGFEDGALRAAVSVETGASIADPFAATVRIVEMLLVQTAWARQPKSPRLRPIRRPASAPC